MPALWRRCAVSVCCTTATRAASSCTSTRRLWGAACSSRWSSGVADTRDTERPTPRCGWPRSGRELTVKANGGRETVDPRKTPKKAALASAVGSILEYYDFFIYGTAAALVFGKVFFPDSDPATGTLLSFATFGVGYVARPIGAFFMGHLGDRHGRKRVLILTLTMMGTATFLVGCLPSYASIGIWAPVLLVILRLLQGFSASGEQSGANSLTLEHAPDDRRAFFSSFTLTGTQCGLVIATAAWLPIGALPEDELLSWGWRIPFWLSVVVVAAGVLIRRRLEETPLF